jgi:hypothetical protein
MSAYTISKDRASFVEEHFFQWSFDDDMPDDAGPDKSLFLQLDHPAELHYLAAIYNWDDGPIVLDWILDSPLCSRATANLIFWRSAPDYYLRYDLNDLDSCPGHDREVLSLLSNFVRRYAGGSFHEIDIDFDPEAETEEITTQEPKWEFPAGVYDRIHGLKIQTA